MKTISGTRRRRCSRCGELKTPNPDHRYMCAECVPLHEAEVMQGFDNYRARAVAEIKARTPEQNLSIALSALKHPRKDRYYPIDGVHNCGIMIDADVLEWLVAVAASQSEN
jgi:hypothetical protein